MSSTCDSCKRPNKPTCDSNRCGFSRMQSRGRELGTFATQCHQYMIDRDTNQLKSSYDQRQWYINNAEKLMKMNTEMAARNADCPKGWVGPVGSGPSSFVATGPNELLMEQCGPSTCEFKVNDPTGLGMGRNFASL